MMFMKPKKNISQLTIKITFEDLLNLFLGSQSFQACKGGGGSMFAKRLALVKRVN